LDLPVKADREAVFHPEFRQDLRYWVETDRKIALRALELIEGILRDPFTGIGKPEPLKYILAGCWSRRLTQEHRLVYRVSERRIDFLQARYHY
jgi:toxin YoeB